MKAVWITGNNKSRVSKYEIRGGYIKVMVDEWIGFIL